MPLVFSACSTIYLTMYSTTYAESFGRTLFSAVRSSALATGSPIPTLYSMRGGLNPAEDRLTVAVQNVIDSREPTGEA